MRIWIHSSRNSFQWTELRRNVLKFGYGINYKYEGILFHSFDRFYMVAKYELPKVEDLKFITISYDSVNI